MKVNDVIRQAETLADETYDVPVWVDFINAALDDLTPVAKMYKEVDGIVVSLSDGRGEIDISSHPELALAHEVLSVHAQGRKIRRLPASDNISTGYKLVWPKIIIQNLPGTLVTCRIGFYSKLKHVAGRYDDIEAVSGLPEQYHYIVVLYCCAKAQQKEEELQDKSDFYAEYLAAKQQMALDRIRIMEPHKLKNLRTDQKKGK